jgi:hypothetical protein
VIPSIRMCQEVNALKFKITHCVILKMSSGLRRGHFHVLGFLVIDSESLKCILCTSHVWLLPKRVSEDEVSRRIHRCISKDCFKSSNSVQRELNSGICSLCICVLFL